MGGSRCVKQTSSGALQTSHSSQQHKCPPFPFRPAFHTSPPVSPASLSRTPTFRTGFIILLNAVSHPAAQETKGVQWLNPCFLLEICEWDVLPNNNHNNNTFTAHTPPSDSNICWFIKISSRVLPSPHLHHSVPLWSFRCHGWWGRSPSSGYFRVKTS